MTADPIAILKGVFTAIAALLTALAVNLTAGTANADAPNDATVAISQLNPSGTNTPVCKPTTPTPTPSATAVPAANLDTTSNATGAARETSGTQGETTEDCPTTATPTPTPTEDPTTPAPTTPAPTTPAPTTPTPTAQPALPVPAPPVPPAPPAEDPDVALRHKNCDSAIRAGTAKAWHPEFYPKTNRTGWCEGVSGPGAAAPAPAAPKPADPKPVVNTPPPAAPAVDDKYVAGVLKDKYTEVLKSYCSFKLSHTRESDVGGGNPKYTRHDFPGACRYKTEADMNIQGGGTRVNTWKEAFGATQVQQLSDKLDILGLENLAHKWRVEVKTAAWQSPSNLSRDGQHYNPVFKMGAPFGEAGANDVQSEYWGNISGAQGATEANLLEERWQLFKDTFGPVTATPAINGQAKPTIGEYLAPKNPINCAVNGRRLVASEGCG